MIFLKQSTAVTVKIGPALSSVDASLATGLTISQADVRLSKAGGNIAQKNETSTCTHDELAIYDCSLNATDTNTLGPLQLYVSETDTLPIVHDFMVVTANVYDTLCSTDSFTVDLNADQSAATVGTVTTVNALASDAVADLLDESLATHTTANSLAAEAVKMRKILHNKRAYSGTSLIIYDDDGTTPLYTYTLDSATAATSRTPA